MTKRKADAECNLEELAELTEKSPPTLRKLIKIEGFPVVSHGREGVAYVFDARDVKRWMDAHDEEMALADRARADELAQLRLDIYGADEDDKTIRLSPEQRKKEFEALRLKDLIDVERGHLTRTEDVEERIREAFGTLRRIMLALPVDLARDLDLDRDAKTTLRERIEAALTTAVAKLGDVSAYRDAA